MRPDLPSLAATSPSMTIHDHFDGAAHCVECVGPCQLSGSERALTDYVRFTLEMLVQAGWAKRLPLLIDSTLRVLVGKQRADQLFQRAVKTRTRIKP